MQYRTEIGRANDVSVTLRSRDVVREVMGSMSYTAALLLAIRGEVPREAEVQLLDAVLVSLIDHGMQPSALVARLTYHAAPESVQGAMAAGLLGAGSVMLGSMEAAGQLIEDTTASARSDGDVNRSAQEHVDRIVSAGGRVPGLGHTLHREGDPRATRLKELAAAADVKQDALNALNALAEAASRMTGRTLLANVTGVAAATVLELGIPWQLHRGIAIVSRAAGLLAHIGEEISNPMTPEVRGLLRAVSWMGEE